MRVDVLLAQLREIADDRTSGATTLLEAATRLIETGLSAHADVLRLACELVRAQPTMAPIWLAAIEGVVARDDPERFVRFALRVRRAPAALTRVAVDTLADAHPPMHLVTLSYSGAVARAVTALAARGPLRISCAEGRPALEGRRLAEELATAGIPVTHYSDAGLADALGSGTAVLVGADAIGPDCFFNKAGTRMLTAAAAQQGVPVYVLATRDKFTDARILSRLAIREGDPAEIWPHAPAGVQVRNPYFEAVPLDLVSAVITDAGVIGAADVPQVCASTLDARAREALAVLVDRSRP